MVPVPLCQLSGYEFGLLQLCYFGWVNGMSLGLNFWQHQAQGEIS